MLRSHARNGNEFQTPGHRWLLAKHWDAWFLNSIKSKTRLKFMKLGMLSWSGINMPWYKICPIWGRFGYMLLTNRSFSQQAWWFSVGNVPPLGTKRYPLPLIAFKKNSRVNIEQRECCVNFCDFSGFVWTFLCINWVFNAFMCIFKFELHAHAPVHINWLKNQICVLGCMQEMGMNFKHQGTVDYRQNVEILCF